LALLNLFLFERLERKSGCIRFYLVFDKVVFGLAAIELYWKKILI
jgi:hypothetical protein